MPLLLVFKVPVQRHLYASGFINRSILVEIILIPLQIEVYRETIMFELSILRVV